MKQNRVVFSIIRNTTELDGMVRNLLQVANSTLKQISINVPCDEQAVEDFYEHTSFLLEHMLAGENHNLGIGYIFSNAYGVDENALMANPELFNYLNGEISTILGILYQKTSMPAEVLYGGGYNIDGVDILLHPVDTQTRLIYLTGGL